MIKNTVDSTGVFSLSPNGYCTHTVKTFSAPHTSKWAGGAGEGGRGHSWDQPYDIMLSNKAAVRGLAEYQASGDEQFCCGF